MANYLESEFYTQFFFKIDASPPDAAFPLDIAATFFSNFSPVITELLI